MALWLSLSLLAPSARADGPFAVSWQDLSFDDPVAGNVQFRLYAPTEPGPYPLAAFLHGWLGQAWMYDVACEHLASYGYVVVSLDTESGLVLDMEDFADDAVAMMHWTAERSQTVGDSFEGMIDDSDWIALGHSMGGATLVRLLDLEPQIRTAVAFMPYEGFSSYYDALGEWDGSLLLLSGTHDTTAPPPLQQEWMEAADSTKRSLLLRVTDMGHQAVTNLSFGEDPLPDDLQLSIVNALSSSFVRAEPGGDESLWIDLIGPGAPSSEAGIASLGGLEVYRWSRSHVPALWATLDGGEVSVGVAGQPGETGEIFFGSAPVEDGLAEAISAGTISLELGVATLDIDVPAEWTRDLWVAVRLDTETGPIWTRAISLSEGAQETSPSDSDPGDAADAAPDGAVRDSCGCSSLGGAASGWPLLLGVVLRRRGWSRATTTPLRRSSTLPNAT